MRACFIYPFFFIFSSFLSSFLPLFFLSEKITMRDFFPFDHQTKRFYFVTEKQHILIRTLLYSLFHLVLVITTAILFSFITNDDNDNIRPIIQVIFPINFKPNQK